MDLRVYLKNLPSGTKLYSLVSGKVTFKEIRDRIIVVLDHNHCEQLYHWTGRLWNSGLDGECLLFPSADNRNWDTFCPFKKGDIIVSNGGCIAIFDHMENRSSPDTIVYRALRRYDGSIKVELDTGIGYVHEARLATKEEKDVFFDSLTKAGYSWNGDTVVKKKFDPQTLEHFQKVLVRDSCSQCWCGDFFQYMEGSRFVCTISDWTFCIPYNDDTKHLVGTTMPVPEFYRK